MIEVSQLTKKYGVTVALDHVQFSIQPGEVVGLLGPNGAGKTTMLKILTGYLPPTEGTAVVAQHDVTQASLSVRQRIGYLPETNPLYDDLAVLESLEWAGRLRGMSENALQSGIYRVVETCGLEAVIGKDIATLSKGYRQRVGLAQAILHDPEILILDEPTSGLDPNQQLEVRQLIQTLKQKKTVLLSTHFLSEAQSACDRVLIIHHGKIVADGTPETLGKQFAGVQRLILELKTTASVQDALAQLPGVTTVTPQPGMGHSSRWIIESASGMDIREALFNLAVQKHWPILEMRLETVSLEDIFHQLTTGQGT